MLTESFLRYGQPEPPAELLPLRAGPLAVLYDPASGMLRRIKFGDREVLRGIYAAVRDPDWGTVLGSLREVARHIEHQAFRLEFECMHQQGGVRFSWRGVIRGEATGRLRYEFNGEALTTFLRNRIGLCVLHPIRECAGALARQTRTNGEVIACRFPESIEPQIIGQSSFQQLRAVAHEVSPGLWAQVEFEGDTFEMEDQRNWTDASFKTYCTPLALPFPVEVTAGTRIRQAVTLKLLSERAMPTSASIEIRSPALAIELSAPDAPTARLPAIGLGMASDNQPLSAEEIRMLRTLGVAHLRVDVRLADQTAAVTLACAIHQATELNARLELALHLPREREGNPRDILNILHQHPASLGRILALREGEPATSPPTLAWVRDHLAGFGAPIGAGSDCNFCELNREHALGQLALTGSDFLFWSINPQVHATDHRSVMETLEAQTATALSARAFAAGRPLVISPVTLKQRFNPVATGNRESLSGELPPQVDPRQLSHFAASWTLGSIAALTDARVESVTYYETVGWRGVLERIGQPVARPDQFPATPGAPFPVFHVLSQCSGFDQAAPVHSSQPECLMALGLFTGRSLRRVLVANPTPVHQTGVVLWRTGARSPLELEPYEVASVDLHD